MLVTNQVWCFGSMRMFMEKGDDFRRGGSAALDLAYVADGAAGLRIIDVSNPSRERLAAFKHLSQNGFGFVFQGGHQIPDGLPDMLIRRKAVHLGESLVDPDEPQISIEHCEPKRRFRIKRFQLAEPRFQLGAFGRHFFKGVAISRKKCSEV